MVLAKLRALFRRNGRQEPRDTRDEKRLHLVQFLAAIEDAFGDGDKVAPTNYLKDETPLVVLMRFLDYRVESLSDAVHGETRLAIITEAAKVAVVANYIAARASGYYKLSQAELVDLDPVKRPT